jgi:hypothetical protein
MNNTEEQSLGIDSAGISRLQISSCEVGDYWVEVAPLAPTIQIGRKRLIDVGPLPASILAVFVLQGHPKFHFVWRRVS